MVLVLFKPPLELSSNQHTVCSIASVLPSPNSASNKQNWKQKTRNEVKRSDVASSGDWGGRGSRCPAEGEVTGPAPLAPSEAGESARAANPHLERERLCGSGEDMLHGAEGQTVLCKSCSAPGAREL